MTRLSQRTKHEKSRQIEVVEAVEEAAEEEGVVVGSGVVEGEAGAEDSRRFGRQQRNNMASPGPTYPGHMSECLLVALYAVCRTRAKQALCGVVSGWYYMNKKVGGQTCQAGAFINTPQSHFA